MVTANEFGFTLGKVERSPVGFRENRSGEDEEGNDKRDEHPPTFSSLKGLRPRREGGASRCWPGTRRCGPKVEVPNIMRTGMTERPSAIS